MERIKINAKGGGEATFAEIEILAQSITEGFLTDDSNMEGNLTVNGAYEDVIEVIEGKFPKVHIENIGVKFIRVDWDDEEFRKLIEPYIPVNADGFIEYSETLENTILPTIYYNSSIVSCKALSKLPIKNYPNRFGILTSLTQCGFKYLETATFGLFMQSVICKHITLPSLKYLSGSGNFETTGNTSVIDCGPNATSLGSAFYGYTSASLVLRNSTQKTSVNFQTEPPKVYVPQSMLATYKSAYTKLADRIFPIGGPTWVSEFGSSDPYADLTDEELSWYEELFPNLYKDWTAPTTD